MRFDEPEFRARASGLLQAAPLALTRSDDDLNPDARAIPHERPPQPAAVLVPIIRRRPELTVLLTERTAHLRNHGGQISFPGGKIDDGDAGPVAAALREAFEETGLDPGLTEPLGFLEGYHTRTGYGVTPVVALVQPDFPLVLHAGEVASAFEVPLRFLMTAGNHRRDSREWQSKLRFFHALQFEQRYIWGATAGMIYNLFERMYAAP